MRNRRVWIGSALVLLAGGAALTQAGDLDPPAGPIAPTMKSLSQVEPRTAITALPYTISAPGSYYVTANLTGKSGQNGISITVSDVTLDLSGFELIGVSGSLAGIAVPAAQVNIRIRNGTIRDWGGAGVDGSLAANCQLEALRAFGNGGNGLHVDQGSTVADCAVRLNVLSGIIAGNGSTIRDCSARNNGVDGIQGGAGSTITACSARDNVDDGIQAGAGGTVTNCTSTSNDDDGINVGLGCTVIGCTAAENGSDGIQADANSTIRSCTASLSVGNGIRVTNACSVDADTCTSNTAAGVHATGTDNRIDGNHVTSNARGIDVDSAGNLIVRNSSSGNGVGYDIVAGNKVGTITGDPTTANAWANFEF